MRLHPSHGALLAWDAEELGPRRTRRVARHLARCPRCRAVLTRRREVREVVREVTSPPAPDVLDRVLRRVGAGDPLLLPDAAGGAATGRGGTRGTGHASGRASGRATGAGSAAPRRRRRPALAAGVALLLTAGSGAAALAVLDGGAVRSWLGLAGTPPTPAPVTGVDVEVPASGVDVELRGVGPGVVLAVERGEGDLLEVTVDGAGPDARFRIGEGRLEVSGVPNGEVLLSVPGSAPGPVRITAGATTLAVVQDGLVRMRGREPAASIRVEVAELLGDRGGGGRP